MYKKIIKAFYGSAVYLLFALAILVVLTSLLWLVRIPLTVFQPIVSLILAFILLLIFNRKNFKRIIISTFLAIFILFVSVFVQGYIYDQSDDGNTYHKETINNIKEGWNPIYDDYKTYAKEHNLTYEHQLWAEHYPKATWIIGGSIYKITNNIETAKAYNLIFIYIAFVLFSYSIYKLLNKKFFNILAGLIVVINPIVVSQVFSFYIDGLLGLLLYLVILYMYLFIKNDKSREIKLILLSLIILISNVKFTGLAYCGLFCLGYYIYYILIKIKSKEYDSLKQNTIFFVFVVFITVLIAGSNSYVKNTIVNKHPLYPLFGKDKVDIITYLQPESFANLSALEKNFYSIFSRSANIGVFNGGEPSLKVPFAYSEYEVSQIGYDTRIGGYGVLFSGIFIVSIFIIFGYLIRDITLRNKNIFDYLIPIIISGALMIFLSDGWWARYSPQTYVFVIIAFILLLNIKNLFIRVFTILFACLLLRNSWLCGYSFFNKILRESKTTAQTLERLENKQINLYLDNKRFTGLLPDLKDHDILYKLVPKKNDKMKNLYNSYAYYEEDNYEKSNH